MNDFPGFFLGLCVLIVILSTTTKSEEDNDMWTLLFCISAILGVISWIFKFE